MASTNHLAAWFVQRYRALGLSGSPSSEAQLRDLQSALGISIPSAYGGFLLTMGVEPDEFLRGTDCCISRVPHFRSAASRLLDEGGLSGLPENAIVFAMHQGYQFLYISCDGTDDSPVFHYLDGASAVERKFERFSQWVELCAEEKRDD